MINAAARKALGCNSDYCAARFLTVDADVEHDAGVIAAEDLSQGKRGNREHGGNPKFLFFSSYTEFLGKHRISEQQLRVPCVPRVSVRGIPLHLSFFPGKIQAPCIPVQ